MSTRAVIASSGVSRRPVPTGHGFIGVDTDDSVLYFGYGGGTNPAPLLGAAEVITAAPTSVTGKDNGKTFFANSSTSILIPLPSAASVPPGFKVRLVVTTLTAAGGHALDPGASDTILGNGLSKSAGDALVCTAATDRIGDTAEVVSDGLTSWYITDVIGTWA